MHITRADQWPEWPRDQDGPHAFGQWEWCRLIPQLHRILAGPDSGFTFPRFRKDFDLFEACGYWETAYYLLRRLVGWRDLGAGLQWWYRQGKSDLGDLRLRLLRELWDDHGQLSPFAMWTWTSSDAYRRAAQRAPENFNGREFLDALERDPPSGRGDPYHGGTNPLHLGHSIYQGDYEEGSAFLVCSSEQNRRAILMVERAAQWHVALHHHGAQLPDLGDRSWHVDVVAKAVGWLGSFRRSRVTGEWFQGKHSIHVAGWREPRHA